MPRRILARARIIRRALRQDHGQWHRLIVGSSLLLACDRRGLVRRSTRLVVRAGQRGAQVRGKVAWRAWPGSHG